MGRLRQAVLGSPMEVFFGAVMVGFGLFLGIAQEEEISTAGGVLGIFGGLLASWGVTKSYVGESATEDLRSHLRPIGRHLGTVSGQIGQAARDLQSGRTPPETSCALIIQSTTHLSGLLSDMEEMTGERLDPGTLIETAERVAELASGLAQQSSDPETASDVQSEVAFLKTQLEQAKSRDREYREEVVTCPNCGSTVGAKLGTLTGDSAMPRCGSCDTRFHVHRGSDGSAFTNPLRSATGMGDVACPGCSTRQPVPTGYAGPVVRYCLTCYLRLVIDPTGHVIDQQEQEVIEADLLHAEPAPAVIKCSQCNAVVSAFFRQDHEFFGVCNRCDRLLRARDLLDGRPVVTTPP